MRFRSPRFQILALMLMASIAKPTLACEPVVPFMQVMVPALALSGSILVLVAAVVLKSVLFAFFERRLPRLHAAWRMFLGNVLTSFCWPGRRCDDCERSCPVARRSTTGLWFVLDSITKSRESGSAHVVGPHTACGSRRDHDGCYGGELHFLHGRTRSA